METVDPLDVGFLDTLDGIRAASMELARFTDVTDVAEGSLALALSLTKSSIAFIGLVGEGGVATAPYEHVYARSADTSQSVPRAETERLIASATTKANPAVCSQNLIAGGETIGAIGIARDSMYTDVQRQAFAIFAQQVASSIHVARLRQRRQEMVDALVNLRADVERSEKQRLLNEERAASAERVEKAHELAVEALLVISMHARSSRNLTEFYQDLAKSVGDLVGARKVLFWQVDKTGMLSAVPGGYGVDKAYISSLRSVPCGPERDDLASRVVFKDFIYIASVGDGSEDNARILAVLGVSNAISVPWRAGDHRLGILAAYDTPRPEGFSREDSWVLQKAGLAAGLVWQLKLAEADLTKTVDRLQKVDAARQMLLKTVSSAVDIERKRFANELHDDALQKLTAAELHLQRLDNVGTPNETALVEARGLLGQTEDALRRLLFEVRPPALDSPGGLEQSIRDRLTMLRSVTGIEAEVELDLPDGLAYEFKSMVFRQLSESLTNIEKHARATQIRVRVVTNDGGIHGLVADNGRGFVVSERNNLPGHLGLLALKERALMAGGWYKIESQPGLGTRIEFWMPITG